MKAIVVKEFRDIKDFSRVYNTGDEVDFDESRIKQCVALGLVVVEVADGSQLGDGKNGADTPKGIITIAGKEFEKAQVVEALKNIEVKVAINIRDVKLIERINELDEEDMAKLEAALGIEETKE